MKPKNTIEFFYVVSQSVETPAACGDVTLASKALFGSRHSSHAVQNQEIGNNSPQLGGTERNRANGYLPKFTHRIKYSNAKSILRVLQ
jgi:hypothetical protein